MDCESERMRQISFVDVTNLCNQLLETWYSPDPKPSFELDDAYCDLAVTSDFGQDCLSELRRFWNKKMKADYSGESGRRRAVMATINLRDRDTLLEKLAYILCPVLWLHVSFNGRLRGKRIEADNIIWNFRELLIPFSRRRVESMTLGFLKVLSTQT